MDRVDHILAQWRHERPDLDVAAMGPIGRLSRISRRLSAAMETTHARFGLNSATFDVLATLRRTPPPHALTPGDLIGAMMVTSGTVTNRIDQLEHAGLVAREENPRDRRSVLIALTDTGFATIESAIVAHVETQARLLEGLAPEERAALDASLRRMIAALEGAA